MTDAWQPENGERRAAYCIDNWHMEEEQAYEVRVIEIAYLVHTNYLQIAFCSIITTHLADMVN